jgi:hypothetical protein
MDGEISMYNCVQRLLSEEDDEKNIISTLDECPHCRFQLASHPMLISTGKHWELCSNIT